MSKCLAKLEEVKQEQRQTKRVIDKLMTKVAIGDVGDELPEDVKFPLSTMAELDEMDVLLSDSKVLRTETWPVT